MITNLSVNALIPGLASGRQYSQLEYFYFLISYLYDIQDITYSWKKILVQFKIYEYFNIVLKIFSTSKAFHNSADN